MTSADEFVVQLIIDRELVPEDTVDSVRTEAAEARPEDDPDTAVLEMLISQDLLTHEALTSALADEFSMEMVEMGDVRLSPECEELITAEMAQKYHVFPLEVDDTSIQIAISDPLDVDTLDNIGHVLGKSVDARLATYTGIDEAIKEHYKVVESSAEMSEIFSGMSGEEESLSSVTESISSSSSADDSDGPIVKFVEMLISEALRRRSSDIHLEPLEKRFRVRYRIDGVLQEIENPPKRLQPTIISRLKLMAKVSLAEKRIPQDGRISVTSNGKEIDLRVSVLPTAFGESIVMRILDKEGLKLGLPQLGFFSDDQSMFERIIEMPDGIFLVTGPTGSGKSTTLYSALNVINHPDRKIITVEDPVEYELGGINQVQVRKDIGMTFSAALKAMLRQAPNIIMVGEIRDKETAEIAVNASLTGHMVFSTLHTNDAPSAVSRLVDIGVKPFLVAASLRAVLAQRLVRQIDPSHREPYEPTEAELAMIGLRSDQLKSDANFMKGIPHPANGGTGFKGRKGLFEMFMVNEEMQQMIYENRTLVDLRQKARELGMRTLREDGVRKVVAGITSVSEVLHVTVAEG
ncbi:MAG: ATPase, T2SS/T4P/T4SS family [Verrucomicrobiota bacterium]